MAAACGGTCSRREGAQRHSGRRNRLPRLGRQEQLQASAVPPGEWPFFYAFDLLACDGQNLRDLPLLERKRRLGRIMPKVESRVLLMEHIGQRGCDLFAAACERDLEGIVAKWRLGCYTSEGNSTS